MCLLAVRQPTPLDASLADHVDVVHFQDFGARTCLFTSSRLIFSKSLLKVHMIMIKTLYYKYGTIIVFVGLCVCVCVLRRVNKKPNFSIVKKGLICLCTPFAAKINSERCHRLVNLLLLVSYGATSGYLGPPRDHAQTWHPRFNAPRSIKVEK